ncbi:MAG: 8-oxoguanine deaminase [Pseudomonadota bacterium]
MNTLGAATLWIANPAAAWTGDGSDAGNGVVIQGNRVVECVPAGRQPRLPITYMFDASDLVLLPGLINCHHHFYQTLTRALPAAQNRELFDWLRALYPVWANMDAKAIKISTQLALAELLLSGCTTAVDHHYLFADGFEHAIDIQVEANAPIGMRLMLTRGSMSLGESRGGLPPDKVVQDELLILDESRRLIGHYHQRSDDAMVQIALAPCSPFSVSSELMKDSAKLAREQGVLLHTHLAETADENQFCLKHFGMRPVDYLESLDWLAGDTWFAHGIHFTDEEIARLGAVKAGISHCPSSNMILASGICKVKELEAAGANVGLGVDGSASNDHSNMIQEVRQAFLLQRLRYGSANVSVDDALRWATVGGARLLHRPTLGSLAAGQLADLALYDLDELRFSGTSDPLSALITSGSHRAKHVMVNGEWRVKDFTLADIDLQQLQHLHRAAASRLVAG